MTDRLRKKQKYPVIVGYAKAKNGPWQEYWNDGKFRKMPLYRRILKCFRLL